MSKYINQRNDKRKDSQNIIRFSRWGGNECYDARINDCSQNGICFTSEFPYLPGTEIAIKMDKQDEESLVNVVWNRMISGKKVGKTYYKVGAKFIEPVI